MFPYYRFEWHIIDKMTIALTKSNMYAYPLWFFVFHVCQIHK